MSGNLCEAFCCSFAGILPHSEGYGTDGQLGQGSNSSIGSTNGTMGDYLPPIDLGTDRKALALATGGVHACAGRLVLSTREGARMSAFDVT